jgi:hypothetical protein
MKFSKLRIAWLLACGFAAVLVCVLWVRSYWQRDRLEGPLLNGLFNVWSMGGQVTWLYTELAPGEWKCSTTRIPGEWHAKSIDKGVVYKWSTNPRTLGVAFHYWIPATLCTILAALPWLPFKRFSLRTLLIVTTLIAVLLGLVMWLRN